MTVRPFGEAAWSTPATFSGTVTFDGATTFNGAATFNAQLLGSGAGSDAAPDIAFVGAADSGLRHGSGDLRLILDTNLRARILTTRNTYHGNTGNANVAAHTFENSVYNASSGTQDFLRVLSTVNQSGTAGYRGVTVEVTESGTGSGEKKLFRGEVGGTEVFHVDNAGDVKFGTHTAIGAETVTGFIVITDAGGTSRKLAVVS